MSTQTTSEEIAEIVKHAVKGDDEPMEEQAPQATFALVSLAYPLMLVGIVLVGFLVWGLFFS